MAKQECLSTRFFYSPRRFLIELLRFNTVGILNTSFFFLLNYVFNWLEISSYKSLTVWAPAWIVSSIQTHAAHRWITFRSHADYRRSLLRVILIYAVTGLLSSLIVLMLVDVWGVDYWVVWLMNTIVFGLLSFVGLRSYVFPPSLDASKADGIDSAEVTEKSTGCGGSRTNNGA
jgi:putative flippase GtrA